MNQPSQIPNWLQPFIGVIRPLHRWLRPRLGVLRQYPERPLKIPRSYLNTIASQHIPALTLVTPSFNQGVFLLRTMRSVIDQNYPNLEYVIQDGGSTDGTVELLTGMDFHVTRWESTADRGQSHAINKGFQNTTGDIMGWINSDDILLPGALAFVARYFSLNPHIDVVYGHRLLIDEHDAEIGTWLMPRHEDSILYWADFIPQETMFWRRRIWDRAGGRIDESFQFAMDWELILRFHHAGAKFARLPRFLGGFRVHANQKTSASIGLLGLKEMGILRRRELGRTPTKSEIDKVIRNYQLRHLIREWFWRMRWYIERAT